NESVSHFQRTFCFSLENAFRKASLVASGHLVHGGVVPYCAKIDTANHALATLSSWKRKSNRYEYSD
ncbi:hypothetical protein C0J52_11768, partial [Blattella germanica]